jgi:hypothetical protein
MTQNVQTLATTITTTEKLVGLSGVNPRQVLGTVRMPKVRSKNKGRGRRRTKER